MGISIPHALDLDIFDVNWLPQKWSQHELYQKGQLI